MKWLCSASLLLVPALAAAQSTTGDSIQETVIVKALPPGPSDTPKKPPMQVALDEYALNSADFTFPSGLRVIMQEDHSEPLVGITMWIDRGSSSDPLGKEGIAHYIEHLWFKSKHGEKIPQTWDLIDEMGCDMNASTDTDMTNFMTICARQFLPVMLRLESARLTNTLEKVTEAQMLTEREVVRNELRLNYEVGGQAMYAYLTADIFPEGHPYHRSTIGTHESLSAIQLSDIQAFVDAYYKPENVTLVVVGDFNREEALSMLIENFDLKNLDPRLTDEDMFRYPRPGVENPDKDNPDDWYWGVWDPDHRGEEMISFEGKPPDRTNRALPPPQPALQENFHDSAVDRPAAVASWSIPGSFQGDDVKWSLVTSLLNQVVAGYFAEDSRIYADPVTKARYIGCQYWPRPVNGAIMCTAELSSTKVDAAKVGWDIVDQVAGIYSFDPTLLERDWGMGRMSFMRDILLGLDDVASLRGRQFQIAEWAHYTGSPTYHSDMIRRMSEGSVMEAQKAAYEYLKRNRAVISVLKPLPKDQVVLDSSEQAWHGAQRTEIATETAVDLAQVDAAYIEAQAHIPDLSKLHETYFENGLRVWVMPHGEAPLAQVRLILFGGGYSSDADGHYTFARTFSYNDMYTSADYDPLQFAADYFTGSSDNYTTMSVLGSSGNLSSSLWLLRKSVDTLEPDTAGKPQWVKRQQSRKIAQWLDDEPFWFVDHLTQQYWNPGHPITAELMPEDYARLAEFSTTDAKETLDRIYQPANATLLIVGNVDPETATKAAEEYFAGWRAHPGTAVGPYGVMPPPNPPTQGSRVVVFDRPGKSQTAADFTCPVGPVSVENEIPLTMAGAILNQDAFQILRVQLGTTYGAYARFSFYEGGSGYISIGGEFQNSATATAVGVFQEMVEEMERGEVDPAKLKIQQLHRARGYGLGQQSIDAMTGRLTYTSRRGTDWLETLPARLAAVDPAAVSRAMAGCSDHGLITVVGPKEVITPLLDAEGITYEVYDWRAEGDRLVAQYDPKAWKKELKKRAAEEADAPQAAATTAGGSPSAP